MKLMKSGSICGFFLGALDIALPTLHGIVIKYTGRLINAYRNCMGENKITELLGMIKNSGLIEGTIIICLLMAIFAFMFGLGFISGAKKFTNRSGTKAGIAAFVAGVGYIIFGITITWFYLIVKKTTVANLREYGAYILQISTLKLMGSLILGTIMVIFSIFAITYFFTTKKGSVGKIGGLMVLVGLIASFLCGVSLNWLSVDIMCHTIKGLGIILMSFNLYTQSKL